MQTTLSDGTVVPCIGLGTYQIPKTEAPSLVELAIDIGYRHFDCALFYENEAEIGEGLQRIFSEGKVKREDVYITTKLWNTYHRPELVIEGCKQSLSDLKLDYLDMYLMHWPVAYQPGADLVPIGSNGMALYDFVPIEKTWEAMESLVDQGLVKSIGLSNFNKKQIDQILSCCRIKPTMNQVESHLDFLNQELIDYSRSKGLIVTAYSPFGTPDSTMRFEKLIERPIVCEIAKRHNKTAAQILLRHGVQRDLIVIPKSANPQRMKENFMIFDFNLSDDEMNALNASSSDARRLILPHMVKHPDYPFN